jgi:ComF family protein
MLSTCASWTLSLLFPDHCAGCTAFLNAYEALFCQNCAITINLIEESCNCCAIPRIGGNAIRCQACHDSPPKFDHLWWAAEYGGAIQEAILRCKYRRQSHIANRLAGLFRQSPLEVLTWDKIVPVPLHRNRLQSRGYNQAALLAREIATRVGIPVNWGDLKRVKNTASQVHLSASARRVNLKNAFNVSQKTAFAGAKVLLIDDVVTTGATMNACARALKRAGAIRVDGWSVARDA